MFSGPNQSSESPQIFADRLFRRNQFESSRRSRFELPQPPGLHHFIATASQGFSTPQDARICSNLKSNPTISRYFSATCSLNPVDAKAPTCRMGSRFPPCFLVLLALCGPHCWIFRREDCPGGRSAGLAFSSRGGVHRWSFKKFCTVLPERPHEARLSTDGLPPTRSTHLSF